MNKKTISLVAIVVGATLALVSLTADFIGIGTYPGINSAQLIGAAIGLLVILIGLRLRRITQKKEDQQS
jgi:hypothetical protein